jgi:hypothetical protein
MSVGPPKSVGTGRPLIQDSMIHAFERHTSLRVVIG